MSFERARTLVVFTAAAIWLAALAGLPFGLGHPMYMAASLVSAVLLTAALCALVGALLWGRVRRTARQNAYRTTPAAERARTGDEHAGDTAGVLASQVIAATGSVGCVAVFVSGRPGSPVLRSVYSAAGRSGRRGRAVGPDTRFEIGSLTKVFTGLILADMAVRNEVDLDTPLGALLDIPAASTITLRSLATHTSGLPRRVPGPRLTNLLTAHPDPYHGIDLDRVTEALARKPPRAPGTFLYSNVGYQLLGAALAAAARTTWPNLVQQRICGPLGMMATGVRPDESTARGHDKSGLPTPYSDYALLPGAIGLLSTTADLDRFVRAQLDLGSTPLGPAILLSRTAQTAAGSGRGVGWRLKASGDGTLAWHTGRTQGFSALLAVINTPGERRGLAILTNSPYGTAPNTVGLSALR